MTLDCGHVHHLRVEAVLYAECRRGGTAMRVAVRLIWIGVARVAGVAVAIPGRHALVKTVVAVVARADPVAVVAGPNR